jgi:hypothetical protein
VIRPLTLREPAIGAFNAGALTRIRRPLPGVYAKAQPGDLLWIREPFHLAAKFDGLSPTAAHGFLARPIFAADLAAAPERFPDRQGLGKRRHARELLRAWHRQHARVVAVEQQKLQALTDEEARAEGFRDRAAWSADWDRSIRQFSSEGDTRLWQFDPTVLVLTLERVAAPLPEGRR